MSLTLTLKQAKKKKIDPPSNKGSNTHTCRRSHQEEQRMCFFYTTLKSDPHAGQIRNKMRKRRIILIVAHLAMIPNNTMTN